MTTTTTLSGEAGATQVEPLKPGAHYGIDFATYANWPALNWHTLSPYRISAKQGRHEELHPDDASDSQVFGEAFHCAILEPERFSEQYITRPKFDGHPNSNAYKAAKGEWEFNNADKVHLSADEMAELRGMQDAVRSNPIGSAILAGKGRNEMSIVWNDKESGVLMKGRVDRLCRVKIGILDPTSQQPEADAIVMVDFKTTRVIEPRLFNKERAKYGYHAQLALYADGIEAISHAMPLPLIVAVQNAPPFDVVVYQPDDDAIENGRRLYRRLARTRRACAEKKRWPGISDRIIPLSIDIWEKEHKLED